MRIEVDSEGLASTAVGLAASAVTGEPITVTAPGADPVSQGAAAILRAHTATLSARVAHSAALRAGGGAALAHTAGTLQEVDVANAAGFAADPRPAEVAASGAAVGSPISPVLPVIPALPPPPVMTGEAFSTALHAGPGSGGLREAARALHEQAGAIRAIGEDTGGRAASIDAQWVRSVGNRAAANTAAHGWWLDTTAGHYETVAAAADSIAEDYDGAVHRTPSPHDFQRIRSALERAAAGGDLAAVARLQGDYARMQTESIEAAATYHSAVASTATTIVDNLAAAPAIARGGDDESVTPLDTGRDHSGRRAMPIITQPGALGPPNMAMFPGGTDWVEVGPGSGIWLPKDQLRGAVITAPGALGPPSTGLVPGGTHYVELIPGSGVWLPTSELPAAIFEGPGSLGPAGAGGPGGTDWVEWLPGSGIWLPRDQVYEPGP